MASKTKAAAEKIEAPAKGKAVDVKAPEAPKAEGAKRFASKWGKEQVVTLLVDYNPKRVGSASHARFENYEDGATVKDALDAGVTAGDLNWDVKHGFIKIDKEFDKTAEKKTKPEPKTKAEKAEKAPANQAGAKTAPAKTGKGSVKAGKPVEEEEEC